MRSALFFASCGLAVVTLLAMPAAVDAQQVYKWKDASGRTHYGERPPASGKYTVQEGVKDPVAGAAGAEAGTAAAASGSSSSAATATSSATTPTAPDPRCNTARNNLATLQGKNAVQFDSDRDGKPDRTLTDSERTNQMELARSTLKAYNCSES